MSLAERGKTERTFTVVLTDKELNYLDSALRAAITEHEFDIFRWGKDFGNVAKLLWFTKRLRNKLKRVHYPPNGKPKLDARVMAIIRKATRKGR